MKFERQSNFAFAFQGNKITMFLCYHLQKGKLSWTFLVSRAKLVLCYLWLWAGPQSGKFTRLFQRQMFCKCLQNESSEMSDCHSCDSSSDVCCGSHYPLMKRLLSQCTPTFFFISPYPSPLNPLFFKAIPSWTAITKGQRLCSINDRNLSSDDSKLKIKVLVGLGCFVLFCFFVSPFPWFIDGCLLLCVFTSSSLHLSVSRFPLPGRTHVPLG